MKTPVYVLFENGFKKLNNEDPCIYVHIYIYMYCLKMDLKKINNEDPCLCTEVKWIKEN